MLGRLLQALAARLAPASDEGAVAELADGDGSEEDLLSDHEAELCFEPGPAATAERGAEDAGVDDDPHESRAAAKASSSSSDSSSIKRTSTETRTGAAAS